jgi:hypothetical protein
MKEIEFIDKFCEYLKQRNYVFKRELRRGSYYSQGFIDIVIQNPKGFLCAIEAKLNAFQEVLHQASSNRVYFRLSYILYPRMPSKDNLAKIKKIGVGLILPNQDNSEFNVKIKPPYQDYYHFDSSYSKIQRNWDENRVGRYLTPKEIPDDYSEEQRNRLKPDYSYTKIKKHFLG